MNATASALAETVGVLGAIGPKRSGTEGAHKAADWLRARFAAAGIADVSTESYVFPRHDVRSSALAIAGRAIGHDVLDGSGAGRVRGEVVAVGTLAEPSKIDLHGKIALVDRHPLIHRSAQYERVAAAGASAMIYVSTAPDDLRQVGSVRSGWQPQGPIPAVTISAGDGRWLRRAIAVNRMQAAIEVDAAVTTATGENVIARIPGRERGQLVIGAHYDTWFAGSTDNGAGVAALVELAERRAHAEPPPCDLVFVAFDGEELALYGAYDFQRRHGSEPIRGVIDLETPAARGTALRGLAHSDGAIDAALRAAELDRQYASYVEMDLVPRIFGGVIPTDVQGFYRAGIPVASTAVDAPYYHTIADTPDKVDLDRLAAAVDGFDRAIDELAERAPSGSAAPWRLEQRIEGDRLTVAVRDRDGKPQAGATVEVTLFGDGFLAVGSRRARTDARGEAVLPLAPCRWLHVAASERYPLAEAIVER